MSVNVEFTCCEHSEGICKKKMFKSSKAYENH